MLKKQRAKSLGEFYNSIPVMANFVQIFDARNYAPPPEDWQVVVTDVVNSTVAIENGKYKDVNVAGALPAMAITNYVGHMHFPFVFGGDGMLYIIPPDILEVTRDILLDTRLLVKNIMDLDLRTGIVPIKYLIDAGKTLSIARLRVSNRYIQAIIDGDGADYAETLVKDPATTGQFQIRPTGPLRHRADFTGFSCRWKPINSPKGETISLIVRPQSGSALLRNRQMHEIFLEIRDIFGDPSNYRPVRDDNQEIGLSERYLRTEASVLSRHTHGYAYRLRLLAIRIKVLLGKTLGFPIQAGKLHNNISSDFRKFDGTLKMVISCTPEERLRLSEYLDRLYAQQRVFYGIHIAARALLTCLVQRGDSEVHFVDTENGGYALAAKQLKQQIAETKLTE